MREIKFRGKRLDNGEWVVGHYIAHRTRVGADNLRHLIICNEEMSQQYPVDPQTVGQFTGILDKEIYEGDRVKEEDGLIYEVQWHECEWMLFRRSTTDPKTHWYRHSLRPYQKLEVIGNIYDKESPNAPNQ